MLAAWVEGYACREPPRTYSNLWVILLDEDGCCREFVEWYMKQPS